MKTKITFVILIAACLTIFGSSLHDVKDVYLSNTLLSKDDKGPKSRITTRNGMVLPYQEYGDMKGKPVLYYHGFPGSHFDIHLFTDENQLIKMNIRLIAVNRPGYNNSEGMEDRTLQDWATNIEELPNHLGYENISILAYSGGAPFAYACYYYMPERLNKVIIVSGMTPADAPEAKKGKAMTISKATILILKGFAKLLRTNPEKFEASMRKGFPEVDQLVYDIPKVKSTMMNTIQEGMKISYQGAFQDAIIYKKDWGFKLSDIDFPIRLYHGEEDLNVRIESVLYVTKMIPNCESIIIPYEGHLSLIYNNSQEILKTFFLTRLENPEPLSTFFRN